MVNVGVIGLGMMGLTHLDAYAKRNDVKVVAIADKDPDRLSGKVRATGNVDGQAKGGFDLSTARPYTEGLDLIDNSAVDAVDICLATPLHVQYAVAALQRGKHVLIEKPLARTSADADLIAQAAAQSRGIAMCAMCMRFWPGWTWLKEAIAQQTYGRVFSAHFRRVASMPAGAFYANAPLSGAAILDLHLHDTDFVQFVFGVPAAVYSRGYSKTTTGVDHVITQYLYDGPAAPMISAEGSWAMANGFAFNMAYTVNFENATAVFDLTQPKPLALFKDGKKEEIELDPAMGYDLEIAYFLDCIRTGKKPATITLEDAANSIRIVEAEEKSVLTGQVVPVTRA